LSEAPVSLSPELVDVTTEPIEHPVDSRWLMAYAASVGAVGPSFLDTTRPEGIVAHPLFPVCLEWPAVLAMRDRLTEAGLQPAEAARGVHLTHDVQVRRPIRPGDRLRTTARVRSIEAHRSGSLVDLELVTIDADDEPVAVTTMGTLYRDVTTVGAVGRSAPAGETPAHPSRSDRPIDLSLPIDVPANAAHVYTECSRIWNPIHTDARTATRAGLPGIILHGTATLAMVTRLLLSHLAADDPLRVRRISCRFGAMVSMPSCLTAQVWSPANPATGGRVAFTVDGPDGEPVLRDGSLELIGPNSRP
jgi:acyl dehydratase